MDQGNLQGDGLFNPVDSGFVYNGDEHLYHDLDLGTLGIPHIMGRGPDPNSNAGFPYSQAVPSQTYLGRNSAQNWLPATHTHAGLDSTGLGSEAPVLTLESSSRQLTDKPQFANSPYSPGDLSPLNGPGIIIEPHRPVVSPTIPPATNAASPRGLLNALIQIIFAVRSIIYNGCPPPSSSELRAVQEQLQDALSIVNELISPHQGRERNANDEDKQFRCILCPQTKRLECKNRGTFKRHVTTTHYPSKRYFCPTCVEQGSVSSWFLRKDKHLLHMRQHGHTRLSKEEMEAVTQHISPPQNCAIAGCDNPISTWEEFIDCLCRHCAISDDWDQDNRSDGDDGDDDDNNGDDGNGGGNQYFPQPGNGKYGNMSNGDPHSHYSGNQFGDPNAWGGTGSHQYRGVANGTYLSSNQQSSQMLGSKDARTRPSRPGISQLKPTLTGLKDSQQPTPNPCAVLVDNDNPYPETFRTEVSLRVGSSIWEHHGDLGMKNLEEKPVSDKHAVSILVSKEVSRELQRLRYFETCVFENQKQGSLLTYVHETFVVSEHGHFEQIIESSMQKILYQTVELGVERQPKIPADCLFYLAKEKGHGPSEANLEATRRASPRKRAHLRVRVKAIAGVLALRAAVSKAPLAMDNTEVGDGWELGIPYPAQDDVFKVLAWLVQVLVFFLRMPPNPKVYVMLASGSVA
ncbi:hypothetical protein BDV10DRAFT_186060 [Aspergillus recurvatus]